MSNIACAETYCPDTETVIAIFLEGSRKEFRIYKPVADITGADIAVACVPPSIIGDG